MIEEIILTKTDHGFFILLSVPEVQKKFHQILGSIPDGQRNSCWSSLLVILSNNNIIDKNNENNLQLNMNEQLLTFENQMSKYRSLNCIFSLGNILSSIGLSVQQFRPVPENVIVLITSEVFFLF